jgi:DNA-binding winged helix-turn-helix (wHTH) protein/Tol biopolymer transport system component
MIHHVFFPFEIQDWFPFRRGVCWFEQFRVVRKPSKDSEETLKWHMGQQTKDSYAFGSYRLDSGDRLLYRDDQPVPLPPKVIDTLFVLVENSGHLVEKTVLMEKVWPDVAVEENNLTQNVSLLRKTLGAAGDDRGFIETIPRRGYRFVASVEAVRQPSPHTPAQQSEPPKPLAVGSRYRVGFGIVLLLVLVPGAVMVIPRNPPARPAFDLRQLTTNSTELALTAGAISPDGNHLAYADPAGLHLKLLKTGETHLLTSPEGLRVSTVRWFGDGVRLLVSGISEQDSKPGIWAFGLLNEAPRKLSDHGLEAAPSRDGSQIAFVTTDSHELWMMGANGQSPHRILESKPSESIAAPQWLPSGERIGYAYWYYGPPDGSGRTSLHLDLGSIDDQGRTPSRIPFDAGLTGAIALPGRLLYALRRTPLSDWNKSTLWERPIDPNLRALRDAPRLLATLGGGSAPFEFSATTDGSRIVFLKAEPQSDIYIAELDQKERRLRNTRRLTLDDHNDRLTSWSLDSRSVFFYSDRNGSFDVYRQFIDQQIAQTIVEGPQDEMGVTVSPEGAYYFYCIEPEGWRATATRPITWMKMPVAGGAPQPALPVPVVGSIECARLPSHVCVLVEVMPGELVIHSFDPLKGKGSELRRVGIDGWRRFALSPDGLRMAVALGDHIRIVTLGTGAIGDAAEDVAVLDWKRLDWLSWAPDGKGFYATALWPRGRTAILYLDMQGHIWPLFEQQGEFEAAVIPSPDGRRLAFTRLSSANNAWMLER